MSRLRAWRPAPAHAPLAAIIAFSAVLNTWRLSQNGFANIYYAAGVRSMLRSLHNFFYLSYDPGGLISLDKPPLGLWAQALSAKLFGFAPLSILLPQALAGVAAVTILYVILARRFGVVAGLVGALALAVFPSFVAVARDNNLDAPLILMLVITAGAGIRAAETGRLANLLGCAVLAGLAFNTKALAAYLIVPGLGLAYLTCAPVTIPRRLAHLAAAGLVGGIVSLAWLGYVQATPAADRPFAGDSTNNSVFNVQFSYNGLGRVGGQIGGPGQIPRVSLRGDLGPRSSAKHRQAAPRFRRLVTFGGATGPLRLLDRQLGAQGGWILPFALVGTLAGGLLMRGRRDPRLPTLLVLGGWFLVEAGVLSFGKGIIHPYYVSALGPGAAAMTAVGLVALAEFARRRSWPVLLAGPALAGAVAAQVVLLHRDAYLDWWPPILIGLVTACGLLALALRRFATPALLGALAAMLVAPTAYAATTWSVPVQGTFPAAGPNAAGGHGGIGVAPVSRRFDLDLLAYLRQHRPGRRFDVLTGASTVAAPLILLGAKAAAVGGYGGSDPALSARGLARLVARHDARYVLLGGVFWDRGGNGASRAALFACVPIPTAVWRAAVHGQPAPAQAEAATPTPTNYALYDCAGRAAQLRAAAPVANHTPATGV